MKKLTKSKPAPVSPFSRKTITLPTPLLQDCLGLCDEPSYAGNFSNMVRVSLVAHLNENRVKGRK